MSLTKLERRTRKPLTTTQRKALNQAKAKGGAKLGTDKGEIRARVANVLLELGWVTIVEGTVLISKAGRAKLNEPIPEGPVVYLRQRDGLTTLRYCAVLSEEVIDPDTLDAFWKTQAQRERAMAEDRLVRSRRLANMRKAA